MAPRNNHDPTSSGDSSNRNVQEADLQEMEDVDQSLDALSCALDEFEQRTDDIMTQLRELLDSNREIRRQLTEEKDNASDLPGKAADNNDDEDDKGDNVNAELKAQQASLAKLYVQ